MFTYTNKKQDIRKKMVITGLLKPMEMQSVSRSNAVGRNLCV